ncbi:MAG: cation transporter [Novosphingobium sp. 16-62-11]|uniref:cation:proton antiporter domain-containing protein n=1 Tax=Novosphingobium sp. 17-62-19 TaxID=1970406 RepID=UPI000BC478C6|nr:cation:proton antiporter [Novosphingobium sp. 17-62-19]OYZ45989.1 MAG: cation transporter [Novosphingobium sp. 16-62-11]OZA20561.1 MAG: cation transporter [Novosphingobium sp. 17-62-19]HQS95786.1 cation:proton antiporter [Novosphingobium sp.]
MALIEIISEAAVVGANVDALADYYFPILCGLGAIILMVAWLPLVLRKWPLSLPMICLGLGVVVFSLPPFSALAPHPEKTPGLIERAAELIVIVSLMGAGLKISKPVNDRKWRATWRLLAVAMPVTIIALMVLGQQLLGLGLATALLFAAALAPTDPVLAGDIQIEPGEEDAPAEFTLTSEAGLNDALAFPFIHLALALAAAGSFASAKLGDWLLVDVLWRLSAGTAAGAGLGWLVGVIIYRLPSNTRLSRTGDGFVALGATLTVYTLTEFVHGYGFLAVFIAGLMMRRAARGHDFNTRLHDFADEAERLLMMLLLLLFGGMLAAGLLAGIGLAEIAFAALALLVVRPAAGLLSLIGSPIQGLERGIIAFFGIRGLGSVYYLSYGINHGRFDHEHSLWGTMGLIIVSSVVIHGMLVTPSLARLKRTRQGAAGQ